MGKKRVGLSTKTRFEVFKRDGFACTYCGGHPPSVVLHVDHVIPVASGGLNDIDNLTTSCEACNLGKGARALSATPQSLAAKAKEIEERERQLLGYQSVLEAKRQRLEQDAWRVVEAFSPGATRFRRDWGYSIKRFIEKLGALDVIEAAEKAQAHTGIRSTEARFRYFCAICWRKVRGEG